MPDFPKSAEAFYEQRDHRTNIYVGSLDYRHARVSVTIDDELLLSMPGQVALLTVCNLLSRWCRNVEIEIEDGIASQAPGIPKGTCLRAAILEQMCDADPFGRFDNRGHSNDLQIHIGYKPKVTFGKKVLINARGWFSSVANRNCTVTTLCGKSVEDLLSGIASACLGVARTFKLAIGMNVQSDSFTLDLSSLKTVAGLDSPSSFTNNISADFGRLLLVGAGSVGSSVAYILKMIGSTGRMTVIDGDLVKLHNLNRSPIFGKSNFGHQKVNAVEDFLRGSNVTVNPFQGWWNDFIDQRGRAANEFDVWIPVANEFNVRSAIQNNYPPVMIHCSTTMNWGVNFGRHIPVLDDCLLDRFPEETTKDALGCSTGVVEVQGESIDAALPFLSLFAGVLVVRGLARLQARDLGDPNFALVDLQNESVQSWTRIARDNCLCRTQSRSIHRALNGSTRYFGLTASHDKY